MNRERSRGKAGAARITAAGLGIYAGLLGLIHGICEILQGDVAFIGVMIHAIGAPCQPDQVWHACLPAMTLLPSLPMAGFVTAGICLAMIIWAAFLVQKRFGGAVLILLSVLMLLSGGGFVAPFAGVMAGVAGTQVRRGKPGGGGWRSLAALWPWPLLLLMIWLPGGWLLGYFFNHTMMNAGTVLFVVFDVLLPVLAVLVGVAQDRSVRDTAV